MGRTSPVNGLVLDASGTTEPFPFALLGGSYLAGSSRGPMSLHRTTLGLMGFYENEICSRPAVWSDTLQVDRDMENRMRRNRQSASDGG